MKYLSHDWKCDIQTCSSHDNVSNFSVLAKLLFWSVTVRNGDRGIACNRKDIQLYTHYLFETLIF